jgi:hypothetical protein
VCISIFVELLLLLLYDDNVFFSKNLLGKVEKEMNQKMLENMNELAHHHNLVSASMYPNVKRIKR